jgi:DNA-binding NarL/FixJ family response regulator
MNPPALTTHAYPFRSAPEQSFSMKTTLLLVDDHTLTRSGLRLLLELIGDFEVVGEAQNGREAIAMAAELRPAVVLMDLTMPELNGLEAIRHILKDFPATKVLVVSAHLEENRVRDALRSGASGYLVKSAATSELEIAIHAALKGNIYLSPEVSNILVRSLDGNPLAGGMADPLTGRQREILQMLAEGKSTKEVAFALNLSIKTAEAHRCQIMNRLDIHDLAGLVRYALRAGLITA